MQTCKYCAHTQCNNCRQEQMRGRVGFCCRCHRSGFIENATHVFTAR